jgi:hypothetical protein
VRRGADPLLALVESYINEHLRRVRGASPHTVRAYGHALRLFFLLLARRARRSIADLRLDDITVESVLAFLEGPRSRDETLLGSLLHRTPEERPSSRLLKRPRFAGDICFNIVATASLLGALSHGGWLPEPRLSRDRDH